MQIYKKILFKRGLILILFIFSMFFLNACQKQAIQLISINTPIGVSFPAITTKDQQSLSIKHLKALKISKIKMDVNWEYIEKDFNEYTWGPLDYRINTFIENDIEVFIGISSNLPSIYQTSENPEITLEKGEAFEAFLIALVSRYQNKVTKIQFGNEWDHPELGYKNSVEDFIGLNNILYTVTKNINPSIDIVLGGVTTNYFYYQLFEVHNLDIERKNRLLINPDQHLLSFIEKIKISMANGLELRINRVLNESLYDIADLHVYDEAELFDDIVNLFSNMINKPLLISEYGAPNPDYENFSEQYQLDRTRIILETLAPLDLVEIYHFSLFDHDAYHGRNGLLDGKGRKKLIYELYETRISNCKKFFKRIILI